tara:strand:- start:855 stop:1367 length:513 start_codon:yes stop_codon:yes gene_type:complete
VNLHKVTGDNWLDDLQDVTRDRVREAISSQKQPTVTVLSSLHAAHDALGYLPTVAIEEVAASTEVSINEVWGVATFYTNFRFTPPAEHALEVCWGPTCHLLGADKIKEDSQDILDLQEEGNTTDGKFSLKYNTCLGACSQAPVISIDHRLHGRITPDSLRQLIDKIRGKV